MALIVFCFCFLLPEVLPVSGFQVKIHKINVYNGNLFDKLAF